MSLETCRSIWTRRTTGGKLRASIGPKRYFIFKLLEALPHELGAAMKQWLENGGVDVALLEQVIVTRYRPGAGIGWHTDAPVFGPLVATLSLGADWRMEFRRGAGDKAIRIALPRRSLLIFEGEARTHWQHRIPLVKEPACRSRSASCAHDSRPVT